MNCLHSKLLRYDNNPILADCLKQPTGDDKFPYDRDVASRCKGCKLWKQGPANKPILQLTHKEDAA